MPPSNRTLFENRVDAFDMFPGWSPMYSHRQVEPPPPDIDRKATFIAAWLIPCGICLLVVALRFWSRSMLNVQRKYGWDDWIMLLALACYVGCSIMATIIGVNGGTRHMAYIQPPSHAVYVLKLHQAAQPFGIMTSGIGKISVGFLIMRILANTGRWRQRFLWVLIAITAINSVTTSIFNFVQCDPPAALWDPALRSTATCWDPAVQANYAIFGAAWGCVFDVILALLPISIVWKLKMSWRKKMGLIVLLGTGVFGGAATAVKAYELQLLKERSDFTWSTYYLYIWATIECFLIILCGSIPTYKPIWDRFVKPRMLTGTRFSGSRYRTFDSSNTTGRVYFKDSENTTCRVDTNHRDEELGSNELLELPLQHVPGPAVTA